MLVEGPARDGRRQLLVIAEALAGKALARYGVESVSVLGRAKGAALDPFSRWEKVAAGRMRVRAAQKFHRLPHPHPNPSPGERSSTMLRHPFYDREIPLLLGDHVTAEDGTGAVHTAPGHGVEDFAVSTVYGLVEKYSAAELNPVGGNGVYLPGTPIVEGQFIWKANDAIIELLRENGHLLAHAKFEHSYPHCWRHKTPVAFRTTPQWFISMEKAGLARDRAEGDQGRALDSVLGRGAHHRHDRRTSRLVHLAPAHLGRADRAVRRQGHAAAASAQRRIVRADRAARREGRHRCVVRARCAASCSATRPIATKRSPTSSMSGSIPGVTHFTVLDQRAELARKPATRSCIWKVPTSIAAGSIPRC